MTHALLRIPSAAVSAATERFKSLTRTQQLLFGLGGASALFLYVNRKAAMSLFGKAFDFAKAQAFTASIPANVRKWAPQILSAAQRYAVDPWALAAIMYNESRGGEASGYVPRNDPGGTGDFIPRMAGNKYFQFADPNTGLPPDGKGWGRGLMQVDFGAHNDWFKSGAKWWDAQTNIDKGAEILAWNLKLFATKPVNPKPVPVDSWRVQKGMPQNFILPWAQKFPRTSPWPTSVPDVRPLSGQRLYEAAIAAYNVSYPAVLQALGLGLPAEAGTTRQDYVSKFMSLVSGWQKNFK